MDNHYHLLLQTHLSNLSRSMQWLGTSYTRWFNLRYNRSGHLFQGRFKSILIENEAYMLRLSCYIHRNPLRAGMTDRLAEYPWSSYSAYAYAKNTPAWLNTELILSRLSAEDNRLAYRKKVQQYSNEKKSIWENVHYGFVYGTQAFVDRIKAEFLDQNMDAELPQKNRLLKDYDIHNLATQAATSLSCTIDQIAVPSRIPNLLKEKRDLILFFLWQTGLFTNQKIGDAMGLTYSSVSRRISVMKKVLPDNIRLTQKLAHLKSQIKV